MPHADRYSRTAPLQVVWLAACPGPGRLGFVRSAAADGWRHRGRAWWHRSAELDLRRLAEAGPDTDLWCLVDAETAQCLAGGDVAALAAAAGVGLRIQVLGPDGLPLPDEADDGAAADAERDAEGSQAVRTTLPAALAARIREGRTVALLAPGPPGRAQTLAAAALLHLGLPAQAALGAPHALQPWDVVAQPALFAWFASCAATAGLPPAPVDPATAAMTVYYHRNCADGATAAWIARQACEQRGVPVRLVPLRPNHMEDLALALGADALMVDVCVPPADLDALRAVAASLTVLEHHKTAAPCAEGRPWVHVDEDHCGAMLAWRHFHGDAPAPKIVHYVQDMDLWRNALPHTRAIQRLLRGMTRPELVPAIAERLERDFDGTVADQAQELSGDAATLDGYVREAQAARIGELQVRATSVRARHGVLASDIANAIAETYGGVAVVWRSDRQGFCYSFRSVPGSGPDVAALAQQFGGGGHTHAAGCKTARQILQFVEREALTNRQ